MTGINEISKEVSKKGRFSEAETKEVIAALLETIKKKLKRGEEVSFKGYFTLKRAKKIPKGSKFCVLHTKRTDEFKKVNRGKGIEFYSESSVFRKLREEIRDCKDCKVQKQKLLKTVELLPRISCSAKGILK